jgi:hypothetical protein
VLTMFDGALADEKARCLHCRKRKATTARGLCDPCFGSRRTRERYPLPPDPPQYRGPLCRHCGAGKNCRAKGLCWPCSMVPAIRDLYPSTSKFARKGVSVVNHNAIAPAEPTDAEPGSEEKIAVLAARAERGESLFHDDDPRVLPKLNRLAGIFLYARYRPSRRAGVEKDLAARGEA